MCPHIAVRKRRYCLTIAMRASCLFFSHLPKPYSICIPLTCLPSPQVIQTQALDLLDFMVHDPVVKARQEVVHAMHVCMYALPLVEPHKS